MIMNEYSTGHRSHRYVYQRILPKKIYIQSESQRKMDFTKFAILFLLISTAQCKKLPKYVIRKRSRIPANETETENETEMETEDSDSDMEMEMERDRGRNRTRTRTNGTINYVGIGGTYEFLRRFIVRRRIIEADLFPPFRLYDFARDDRIRDLPQAILSAISLEYSVYIRLVNFRLSQLRNGTLLPIQEIIRERFSVGNYRDAIFWAIREYRNLLTRLEFEQLKLGLIQALAVHVENGLINQRQMDDLIEEFKLDRPRFKFKCTQEREYLMKLHKDHHGPIKEEFAEEKLGWGPEIDKEVHATEITVEEKEEDPEFVDTEFDFAQLMKKIRRGLKYSILFRNLFLQIRAKDWKNAGITLTILAVTDYAYALEDLGASTGDDEVAKIGRGIGIAVNVLGIYFESGNVIESFKCIEELNENEKNCAELKQNSDNYEENCEIFENSLGKSEINWRKYENVWKNSEHSERNCEKYEKYSRIDNDMSKSRDNMENVNTTVCLSEFEICDGREPVPDIIASVISIGLSILRIFYPPITLYAAFLDILIRNIVEIMQVKRIIGLLIDEIKPYGLTDEEIKLESLRLFLQLGFSEDVENKLKLKKEYEEEKLAQKSKIKMENRNDYSGQLVHLVQLVKLVQL